MDSPVYHVTVQLTSRGAMATIEHCPDCKRRVNFQKHELSAADAMSAVFDKVREHQKKDCPAS